MTTLTAIGPEITNGAKVAIETGVPYGVEVRIVGVADLIFHRWNVEGVEAKGKAAKGSKAKKRTTSKATCTGTMPEISVYQANISGSPLSTPRSTDRIPEVHGKAQWICSRRGSCP